MKSELNHRYSRTEETLNIVTHGLGLVMSIIALPFLILKAGEIDKEFTTTSFVVFGFSMIILYAASTFYHAAKNPKRRRLLNIVDHAAIYVLIAGTYTPFCLVVLGGKTGWIVFLLSWIFAIIGIILKLFFTGKFDKISTAMYVLMGWQIIFVIKPLMENLSTEGLQYLFFGGISYTIGAVLYSIKKLPYNHAIFHVFVLAGTAFHFIAIFFCI